MENGTLTTSQVSRALGLSKQAVQRASTEGRLPCTRDANGQRWFREEDVVVYAAKNGLRLAPHQPMPAEGPTWPTTVSPTPEPPTGGPDAGGFFDATLRGPTELGATGPTNQPANHALATIEVGGATVPLGTQTDPQVALAAAALVPSPVPAGQLASPPSSAASCRPAPMEAATLGRIIAVINEVGADERDALVRLLALWKQPFDAIGAAALGRRVRSLPGICDSCAGHGVWPLWAAIADREVAEERQLLPRVYAQPAARVEKLCFLCRGAEGAHTSGGPVCPVCSGSGIVPLWLHTAFHLGVSEESGLSPLSWHPISCPACAGWGWLSPALAECATVPEGEIEIVAAPPTPRPPEPTLAADRLRTQQANGRDVTSGS